MNYAGDLAEREALVSLTAELAAINSINSTLVRTAPGEGEIGRFVHDWMEQRGWEVHVDYPAPGRPNIVGVIAGGSGPRLMINAHLDTVGATPEALEVRVADDRIHGRGVLDTKAGLAAALIAATRVGPNGPPGDIIIAAVSDEEAGSIGTEHLLRTWTADAAIVVEPTALAIATAHRGFAVLEATLRGRSAHTANRHEGINAIDAATRLLVDLANIDETLARRVPHPTLGSATVQVTRIDGGTEIFTVPDRCKVTIELRTLPTTSTADVDRVVSCVDSRATSQIECDYHWVVSREPFDISADAEIVALVRHALVKTQGHASFTTTPFWTDAALLAASGIPSVVFGPGGYGIHGDNEWVLIDDIVTTCSTLRHSMMQFGQPR